MPPMLLEEVAVVFSADSRDLFCQRLNQTELLVANVSMRVFQQMEQRALTGAPRASGLDFPI